MKPAQGLPEQARAEVRRIVIVSRAAGVAVAVALALASAYIHREDPDSLAAVGQLVTVAIGLLSFVTISTLSRVGHARILERSLSEVQDLTAQLQRIAETDPLTGLNNLRAFQEHLRRELDAARRTGVQVSLIVADLDNFKL